MISYKITNMKILTQRALLMGKTLIVADLHIGFETEIYHSGISVPSQIIAMEKTIMKLIKQTKAKELIILGDLKHRVPGTSYQELREIPEFLKRLSKKVKITIIKGNHDADLEKITDIKIASCRGIKLGKYGFVHGHALFSKRLLDCEYVIMAHVHPAVEFKHRMKEPCWIRCKPDNNKIEKKLKEKSKIKQIIIMPSFNPLITGMSFNSKEFRPMGPIMKVIKWTSGEVYLLDGTHLGKLNKLK